MRNGKNNGYKREGKREGEGEEKIREEANSDSMYSYVESDVMIQCPRGTRSFPRWFSSFGSSASTVALGDEGDRSHIDWVFGWCRSGSSLRSGVWDNTRNMESSFKALNVTW